MTAAQLADALDRGVNTPETRQWRERMALIATGTSVVRACKLTGVTCWWLRCQVLAEERLRKRYKHAVTWGRRRRYNKALIEAALAEIAATGSSFRAALLARGFTQAQYVKIARWAQTDSWLSEAYRTAKNAQRTRLTVGVLDRFWSDEAAGTQSGRRRINQAWLAVRKLQSVRSRRLAAVEYRAARAAVDPTREELAAARRRARRGT